MRNLTSNERTSCPACGSSAIKDRGCLPQLDNNLFGGVLVNACVEAGNLYHCFDCDLYFRHPYLSQEILNNLYKNLPLTTWKVDKLPCYWPAVLKWIEKRKTTRTMLDVGCFCGDYLNWLPNTAIKMGIEPNVQAYEKAKVLGIKMVGTTLASAKVAPGMVDIITAFDLIEHMRNPLEALDQMRQMLSVGGNVIIFTGATDTIPWKMSMPYYWYSALPEHVSFLSQKWFEFAATRLKMKVLLLRRFASEPAPFHKSASQFFKFAFYVGFQKTKKNGVVRKLYRKIPVIKRVANWRMPLWWTAARDHMLVVLGN